LIRLGSVPPRLCEASFPRPHRNFVVPYRFTSFRARQQNFFSVPPHFFPEVGEPSPSTPGKRVSGALPFIPTAKTFFFGGTSLSAKFGNASPSPFPPRWSNLGGGAHRPPFHPPYLPTETRPPPPPPAPRALPRQPSRVVPPPPPDPMRNFLVVGRPHLGGRKAGVPPPIPLLYLLGPHLRVEVGPCAVGEPGGFFFSQLFWKKKGGSVGLFLPLWPRPPAPQTTAVWLKKIAPFPPGPHYHRRIIEAGRSHGPVFSRKLPPPHPNSVPGPLPTLKKPRLRVPSQHKPGFFGEVQRRPTRGVAQANPRKRLGRFFGPSPGVPPRSSTLGPARPRGARNDGGAPPTRPPLPPATVPPPPQKSAGALPPLAWAPRSHHRMGVWLFYPLTISQPGEADDRHFYLAAPILNWGLGGGGAPPPLSASNNHWLT